jgi:hypothetical protein
MDLAAVGVDIVFVLFNLRVPLVVVASPSLSHFLQALGVFFSVALPQGLKRTINLTYLPHDPRVIKQPITKIKEAPFQNICWFCKIAAGV